MTSRDPSRSRAPVRRTVAARILLSYVVVLCMFAGAAVFSVQTFRRAAEDADLLRTGYLPLSLSVRDLRSGQDTWNSQLNHVTTAGNPADARVWFESMLKVGRPNQLRAVRKALAVTFEQAGDEEGSAARELRERLREAEAFMEEDGAGLDELFEALAHSEMKSASAVRDALVRRGLRVQRSLTLLETTIEHEVAGLARAARSRESVALSLLVVLGSLTLLVGALMALYARRVVAPISLVTRRAAAVAAGDLTPESVLRSQDEIGELSRTFESMVGALSEGRERLVAAERLAAIGKMAAHVTHEVRNPLSSIALNLDLLEDELERESEEAKALLRAITSEVQRLSGLSDQYLSMARQKQPELEETALSPLLLSAADFMRPELLQSGLTFLVAVPEDLPWLEVDAGQLRQALFNLVRNAREAAGEAGFVGLGAETFPDEVRISVEDDGPGISADEVERLFDPFFTTKEHGTGLGLAVTRQIVRAHGGKLWYEPRAPGGSRFVLSLPRPGEEHP